MMFKTFIAADDYNWRANVQNDRHVFLPTNKTFEGICLVVEKETWKKEQESNS